VAITLLPAGTWVQIAAPGYVGVGVQACGAYGVRLQNAAADPGPADVSGVFFKSGERDTVSTSDAALGLWARCCFTDLDGHVEVLAG
jgi:hypothetical protein